MLILAIIVLKLDHNTLAYGCDIQVIETANGGVELVYYDMDTGYQISPQTAVKYYDDVTAYDSYSYDGVIYYFYYGKTISQQQFNEGIAKERADNKAKLYGKNAYRVHNTDEVKAAFDDIYNKLRYGEFIIVFSEYDYNKINWNTVKSYYNSKYALALYNISYYDYAHYGEFTADRWGWTWNLDRIKQEGSFTVNTTSQIRLTADQRQVLVKMGDKAVAKITEGISGTGTNADYLKIKRTKQFINTIGAAYDTGYYSDLLDGSTSAYSVLLEDSSVCIGHAVTFAYLMQRMGINAYIVDVITNVNNSTQTIETSHSYNFVELGGKYYAVDLMSSRFLAGISANEMKGRALTNASSSGYSGPQPSDNWSISRTQIKEMQSSVKNSVSTTTTKASFLTTTYKSTTKVKSNEVTTKSTKKTSTTSKKTIDNNTSYHTTSNYSTSDYTFINTTTSSHGKSDSNTDPHQTVTVYITTTKKTKTIAPGTTTITTTTSKANPETEEKKYSTTSIIGFSIGVGLLVISLILIIKNKNTKKVDFRY